MADLTLNAIGDKELHVAKIKLGGGEEGIIPLFVQLYRAEKQEFAKVAPAIGLYAEQATRLEYHFSVHNEWKRKDCFLVQRRHLGHLTERVNGLTPAYYYRWPGKELPLQTNEKLRVNGEEVAPIPDDAEDFIEFVHKKRGIDRNVLRLAWAAVSKEAVPWMLKKKKSINLGFVELHAVPYRANWKEILLARFPNALYWFKSNVNKEGAFKDRLAEAEFHHELTNISLMAIHGRDHFIHWTMEAVPSKQWEDDVAEFEMLKKSGGNTAYVRYHEKAITDLVPKVLEIFTSYIRACARSFPVIKSGSHDGSQKLCPYRGATKSLPAFGRTIPVRVVLPDGPPKLGEASQFALVQPKTINGMQRLPRISEGNLTVLGPAPDMAEQANGQAGSNGLRVHDVDQGQDSGQRLLAEPKDQRPDGVEEGVDR